TATGSQEIDVNDNDRAQVTFAGTADVTEGGPADATNVTASLALALTGTGTDGLDVSVSATLQADPDFTAGTVTWTPQDTPILPNPQVIPVTAVNDNLVEGTELKPATAIVTTTALNDVLGSANVTIHDNDTATISLNPAGITTIAEGGPSVGVPVKLTITAGSGGGGPLQLAYPLTVTLPRNADDTSGTFTFAANSADGATGSLSHTPVH